MLLFRAGHPIHGHRRSNLRDSICFRDPDTRQWYGPGGLSNPAGSVSGVALGFDVSWSSHHHVRAPFILSCLLPQSLTILSPSDITFPSTPPNPPPLLATGASALLCSIRTLLVLPLRFHLCFSQLYHQSLTKSRPSLPSTRTSKKQNLAHTILDHPESNSCLVSLDPRRIGLFLSAPTLYIARPPTHPSPWPFALATIRSRTLRQIDTKSHD